MTDASNVDTGGMGRRISEVGDLLNTMHITAQGAPRGFVDRLAEENGWSREHAGRVDREYRRFLLLAWMSPRMVVPSKAVDEAWHLHMIHTRHYWEVTCGEILRKPLHHDPGDGGAEDAERHSGGYEATLALYAATFGEDPPCDVWGCRHGSAAPVETGETVLAMPMWTVVAATCLLLAMILPAKIAIIAVPLCILITVAIVYLSHAAAAEERQRRAYRERSHQWSPGVSMSKASPYAGRSASRREDDRRSDMMDSTGSEAMTAALAIFDSPPAHAASHTHSDGGHSGHSHSSCSSTGHSYSSCSSHSSCSSSSSSCSSGSSCGSSCGGGGCGGS